jgi:hypothetical protein
MNTKPRPQPAGGASSTTHTLTGNDGFIIMPNVAQQVPGVEVSARRSDTPSAGC